MKKQKVILSVADVFLEFVTENHIEVPYAFRQFCVQDEKKNVRKYTVEFEEVSELHLPIESWFFEDGKIMIYPMKNGIQKRAFHTYSKKNDIYAISSIELGKRKINIEYLTDGKEYFKNIQDVFSHIAWERILLNEEKLLLHASYVETPYGGIAFSGPSGIGKSTQADLWCRYEEATLINGDKLIIDKREKWIGYGSVFAGSSGCYVNEKCPLKALVFLKQGAKCEIRALNKSESFRKIYAGLTVNRWDMDCVQQVCNLAQKLAEEVPIYEYICTPTRDAVNYLKNHLLCEE